jgi:hypothetical protein
MKTLRSRLLQKKVSNAKSIRIVVLILGVLTACTQPAIALGDYELVLSMTNQGGGRGPRTDYDLSASLIPGAGEVMLSSDYASYPYLPGQLYTPVELQVTAATASVAENGTKQLAATQVMDDATTLPVPAAEVTWQVLSGPISSISVAGVAQAGSVYQNTAASVQGSAAGLNGTLSLTVLETIPDNYGSYAGDGLPDGWQVQTMGLSGTSGGPALDPDGDGLSNLMEYALGLNPVLQSTLPATTVLNSGNMEFTYTRSKTAITGGTQFQVQWSDTLEAASWSGSGVIEQILSDDGTQQQVKATLPAGSGGRRFVRLRVQ